MISGIVILPYRLLNSEKGKNTMQVKNIISDFLQLRDKVNSELHFVGFLTKNGKRLITRTDSGSEIKVLTDLLKVLSYNKVYKEPFDIILSYFTDKGSITISDIGLIIFKKLPHGSLKVQNLKINKVQQAYIRYRKIRRAK